MCLFILIGSQLSHQGFPLWANALLVAVAALALGYFAVYAANHVTFDGNLISWRGDLYRGSVASSK